MKHSNILLLIALGCLLHPPSPPPFPPSSPPHTFTSTLPSFLVTTLEAAVTERLTACLRDDGSAVKPQQQ